jgi:hypothetical protein
VVIDALDELRAILLALKPTGADGFEGLVADAVSSLTGLVLRLAKSGSQFGRDASSQPGPFAISLEAKRYDDNLRLEVLAGKAAVAGNLLGGDVDLWALGATSEVGDDIARKLVSILENDGVTLVMLDWAARPLPPLAVLLAAEKEVTLNWIGRYRPDVNLSRLSAQLDQIASDPAFQAQIALLRDEFSAAKVGLDALRRRTEQWLRKRLADRSLSQRTFGQYVAVADPRSPALHRKYLATTLGDAILSSVEIPHIVAILGGEGTGKTWLIAQWWATLVEPPILLFVAGKRIERVTPADPLGGLAHLLAEQEAYSDAENVRAWRRRLERWKSRGAGSIRFIVVIDGLNERSRHPWANTIKAIHAEVQALGGLVVVTCREGFWQRDVFPRLGDDVQTSEVSVGNYTDEELSAALAAVGVTAGDLPTKVKEFIRNPRVCAIAVHLIDRLALEPKEVTVERLLLEYWQWRLHERADSVVHNVADFHKLLRSHAKAWRDEHRRSFDRDEWASHSGAARRLGAQAVIDDLTEIEEGRFLRVTSVQAGLYEFRTEVLPFALGLLMSSEVRAADESGQSPSEQIDQILDPIRGFDVVADAVAAAVGLACLDQGFPTEARKSLIRVWFELQNIQGDAVESMAAYFAALPEPFLEIVEEPALEVYRTTRVGSLPGMIVSMRDHPRVQAVVLDRVGRWLGLWSMQAQPLLQNEARAARQSKRENEIRADRARFSESEKSLFSSQTTEVDRPPALQLDWLAALIIAGRPLSPHVSSLWAWSLVQAIAPDIRDAEKELEWLVRLNPVDAPATLDRVRSLIGAIALPLSDPMERAVTRLMVLPGDRNLAAKANESLARLSGRRWRRAEAFCDSDPYDPNSGPPSNLDNARERVAAFSPNDVWTSIGQTTADLDLSTIKSGLVRFEPEGLIKFLREVASTASSRTMMPLRQLGWRLPEIAAILDDASIRAVACAFDLLISDSTRLRPADVDWVACELISALAPHLLAENQLDLIVRLPPGTPYYTILERSAKSISAAEFEMRLVAARQKPTRQELARTLFFAASAPPALTPRTREIVFDALDANDQHTAIAAAKLAWAARDPELDDLTIGRAQQTRQLGNPYDDSYWHQSALAAAIVHRRPERPVLPLVPRVLAYVAARLGGAYLDACADVLESQVARLLRPVNAEPPNDMHVDVRISEDGLSEGRSFKDEVGAGPAEFINNFEVDQTRQSERRRRMKRDFEEYETALKAEDASAITAIPQISASRALANHAPNRVRAWLEAILGITDKRILRDVRALGLGLASAFASHDPELAARVMRRLREHKPFIQVVVGPNKIPIYQVALFSAQDADEVTKLRIDAFNEAFDDEGIERTTLAAETYGTGRWLDNLVNQLVASDSAGAQARGIMIAGFRRPNSESDRVLAIDWGPGFLGDVAEAARTNYRYAKWTNHWLDLALAADALVDFWRFSELAEPIADARFAAWFETNTTNDFFRRFGGRLYERLQTSAEKRSEKRRQTLFGLKPPDEALVDLLRETIHVEGADRFAAAG